ncbi:hypothetical protein, partial [Neisseria sp. HMSC066B07]|uniref:hypothetical protein n=1 Tax=Neisseria sp. HMSC066B07 TaxID=1739476 RepID=UPI0014398D85
MGFNTQPPEGGWKLKDVVLLQHTGFNTQPPEGGWETPAVVKGFKPVSTHSRPKAAGSKFVPYFFDNSLFQHTAARRRL